MGERMSKSRTWTIVTVLLVACIVAIALGLGLGLRKKNSDDDDKKLNACPEVTSPSSSRLTKDSPVYVKPTDIPEGRYRFASVAADTKICSSYGSEMIMRHGGSTVDGAITTMLCAGAYNPQSSGIGGGHVMTYYKRATGEKFSVMAREMAPGAASENMFVGGAASSTEGGKAIAIPGEIRGMYEVHRLGGRLPWSALFRPIIQMCEQGYPVGPLLAKNIQENVDFYDRYPELKKLVTKDNGTELLKEGDILKQPKFAATLRKIADDPFTFYNGSLAADIVADVQDAGGIITTNDLLAYTAAVDTPLVMNISGGFTAITTPPPSSGPVLLLILNILSGYNLNASSIGDVNATVETFHRITEAFKHGFSVRTNLGDSDAEDKQFKDNIAELIANMTSTEWGAAKRAKITYMTHGTAYYEPTFDFIDTDAGTTHISILGPNGDAVSVTSTINTYFGSKVVGSRTGIVFNNEMDDFSTPNTTNYFQVPASPANFIKPYKRPMSSMSPLIALDASGDVILVTGSSGGTRILTSNVLSAIHTLWLKLGMKEAIEYPRIHHQLLPPELRIEKAMPQAIFDGLAERGHKFDIRDKLGSSLQSILRREKPADNAEDLADGKYGEIFAYCDPVKFGRPDGA